FLFFFFQAEDGIRDLIVTGVQTCALPICGGCRSCGGGATPTSDTLHLALINDPILNPVLAPDVGSVLVNKVIFPGLMRPDERLRSEERRVGKECRGRWTTIQWKEKINCNV